MFRSQDHLQGPTLFLAKVTFFKTLTDWFSYINLVLWQRVVLCKPYGAENAPDCGCVCYTAWHSVTLYNTRHSNYTLRMLSEWVVATRHSPRSFAHAYCCIPEENSSCILWAVGLSWNLVAQGDTREGKWRGNWRMQCVASTLHTTSEYGVSIITTADAHTSAAGSQYSSHYFGKWCIQHYYRWCPHLGCR